MTHTKIVHSLRQIAIAAHIISATIAVLAALDIIRPSNVLLAVLIAWANAASLTKSAATGMNGSG
jgi:hypothetical protein